MSPARRHLAALRASQSGAAAASVPAPAEATEAPIPLEPTLAQAHALRHAGAAATLTDAANDNGAGATPRTPDPAALIRMDLANDMRGLKALQSREAKIARKRELLPKYDAYVAGAIDAAEAARAANPGFRAPQDDVVVRILIWKLDVGELAAAASLFTFADANGFTLGPQFTRDLATLTAEEAATFAIEGAKGGATLDPVQLSGLVAIRDAVDGRDMPDQAKSKLHKAVGLEYARIAGDAATEASAAPSIRAAAIAELTRARILDPRGARVDNVIQQLERAAKKAAEPAPAVAPVADTGAADATPSAGGGDPAAPAPTNPPPASPPEGAAG